MLLLMMKSQRDHVMQRGIGAELQHRAIYMGTIRINLIQAGTGKKTTMRPGMARAQRLVIGIEQIGEAGIERPIGGTTRQNHALEKPGSMGQMPFDGTGVRHGLKLAIFGGQW